nr:unnamed protein product [Callosobruchus chinensis]CAH7762458.1 unnamed protein product [Callosobruchus chinensis]CAH7763459.1 unnamed protein product [Callosobruchus chinensis]
MTGCWI